VLGLTAEHRADRFHQHDSDAECHKDLILGRAAVEQPHHDTLNDDTDQKHEQRADAGGQEPGSGRLHDDEHGIGAKHEHRAMREVQHPERAQNDCQPAADEGQQ
jgi:hypothetical protein